MTSRSERWEMEISFGDLEVDATGGGPTGGGGGGEGDGVAGDEDEGVAAGFLFLNANRDFGADAAFRSSNDVSKAFTCWRREANGMVVSL